MFRDDTIKATEIVEALFLRHKNDLCFEELRLPSGISSIDFLAISPATSAGNPVDAYEIKVSRADFRKDSYKKQRNARLYSDRFWYIAPVHTIPHDELPDWAGLIEAKWVCHQGGKPHLCLTEAVPAPKRDKDGPSWPLLVSMVRHTLRGAHHG